MDDRWQHLVYLTIKSQWKWKYLAPNALSQAAWYNILCVSVVCVAQSSMKLKGILRTVTQYQSVSSTNEREKKHNFKTEALKLNWRRANAHENRSAVLLNCCVYFIFLLKHNQPTRKWIRRWTFHVFSAINSEHQHHHQQKNIKSVDIFGAEINSHKLKLKLKFFILFCFVELNCVRGVFITSSVCCVVCGVRYFQHASKLKVSMRAFVCWEIYTNAIIQ